MLQKENRLKNKNAFSATYRIKKFHHKGGITLNAGKENKSDLPVKIGFVVSKKTHKRAVKRNRIKRLMRESVRLYLKEHDDLNKYVSLIFTAHTSALGKTFDEIDKNIKILIREIL
ncbi:MAG: ribonuclease P protein component [Cyanobacteria bacterium RUI128]|nr:ribonuclease P protein component [Cyanobacteria bacterium RUI128]